MSNQKAERSELEFPLLLNLQSDRPHIASDFRSVERLNAPYINGMIQPLWKKGNTFTNRPVYDYHNNRYEIKNGYLFKNDTELFPVEDKHFEMTDITEEMNSHLAFDFDDNGNIATLDWETATNDVILRYGNLAMVHPVLFVNGIILTSRVRVINNVVIGVIVYKIGSSLKMLYMNTATNINDTYDVVWYTCTPKTSTSAAFTLQVATQVVSPSPIINIANPLPNVYAVSLVSNRGQVVHTQKEGFFTFVDNNRTIISGANWLANNGAQTDQIIDYTTSSFVFKKEATSNITTSFLCYIRDGVWYYATGTYDEPVPNVDVNTFKPELVSTTIVYDDKTYNVYNGRVYSNSVTFRIDVDDLHGYSCTAKVAFNDAPETYYTAEFTGTEVVFEHSVDSYNFELLTNVSVILTYDGTDYDASYGMQYAIMKETSSSGATGTYYYITAPNVFLDNGNMYSWYYIPVANTSASGYAITFPTNSMIVESGKLTGFSNSKYNFSVVEGHIVNNLTLYGRENAIAVDQNFWSSSLKMNTAGIRTPYNIYIAGLQPEVITSNCKYTEYSNSNCSDMLYYQGTIPQNNYKFYPSATNNSQDVAWFSPGGYRAPLKGHWNILYNVGTKGSVAIQGISYSIDENMMGTLVTPLYSLKDDEYIMASDDFVVYKDSHDRWYKISLEDGAELSSVFDNKYILVNTPSYWNMWSEENLRKFHYASDYNNRTKIGMTRTQYRTTTGQTYFSNISDGKIARYKYATAINPNYDVLPRYPVTSILPPADALANILGREKADQYIHTYGSKAFEAREVQPIEIYLQGTDGSDTSCAYLASVKSFIDSDYIYKNPVLALDAYANNSFLYSIDILTTFINGAGNNDFAIEGMSKYPLAYNNQNKPVFLYSGVSGIDVDNVKWFFIIQGQYYAVIGEKIYAMIYNNGYVSQADAIVDVRDIFYVGNTPTIAFFINPYTKQAFSFTGDAALQQIFDCSRYDFIVSENTLHHWYDESTQSIFVATEQGLLVFSNQNTFCLEDFKDVVDMEFIDGDIHIIESDKETALRYYHDRDEYETLPIELETSFYGLGSNEITAIDKWQIVLYDPEHREQEVEISVRSLTDVSTVAETKKLKIDKNDWDKWSHSTLINYNPQLIRGKGIRLSVKTVSTIQSIVPHITDRNTSQNSNKKFSV